VNPVAPTVAAAHWLYETLIASEDLATAAPGGVWETPAPEGTELPFVAFDLLDVGDTLGVGASRILSTVQYVVRVVAADVPLSQMLTPATLLDEALHGHSGTVDEGIVAGCVRERPFQMTEHRDGQTYRHLGGVYRIIIA
jgi:hypothetical protein